MSPGARADPFESGRTDRADLVLPVGAAPAPRPEVGSKARSNFGLLKILFSGKFQRTGKPDSEVSKARGPIDPLGEASGARELGSLEGPAEPATEAHVEGEHEGLRALHLERRKRAVADRLHERLQGKEPKSKRPLCLDGYAT